MLILETHAMGPSASKSWPPFLLLHLGQPGWNYKMIYSWLPLVLGLVALGRGYAEN